jgi:hypothetical protein
MTESELDYMAGAYGEVSDARHHWFELPVWVDEVEDSNGVWAASGLGMYVVDLDPDAEPDRAEAALAVVGSRQALSLLQGRLGEFFQFSCWLGPIALKADSEAALYAAHRGPDRPWRVRRA